MKKSFSLVLIALLYSLEAKSTDIRKTESFFLKATENLFNMNFVMARKYFLRAYKEYKKVNDEKKMNASWVWLRQNFAMAIMKKR